ncbi:hypothetical protein VTK26DRAFT_5953 [Humicola hyalothermophila]
MAERHPPSSRALSSGISKSRSGQSSSSHSVRRNLFQSQLTRRPTAVPTTSAGDALHLDPDVEREHQQQHRNHFQTQRLEVASAPEDIVVRDKNGEIELGDPPTPPIDDAEDFGALDAQHENEMERQRLAEALKQHQIDQNSVLPTHPEELLEAVKASLKAKIAALAEDNWMFEREERPHDQ